MALLTILLNSPFTRGCVRVARGSCPAAGAGGQPPHGRVIHRIRSCPAAAPRGGLTGGGKEDLFSPPGWQPPPARSPPISSVPATGPATPALQPSMAVLTTAGPPTSKLEPPFPLQHHQKTTKSRVESCVPLSTGVSWAAKPASDPAPPPTQVVDTTTHHVPLKLAQLAPPPCSPGRLSLGKTLGSHFSPCRALTWKEPERAPAFQITCSVAAGM